MIKIAVQMVNRHVANRTISSSCIVCSKLRFNNAKLAQKTEKKINRLNSKSGGDEKMKAKRKKWHLPGQAENVGIGKGFMVSQSQHMSDKHRRRLQQLGVVLFEYVNALMSSGEISPELLDLDFQVSKVNMLRDMSGVHVHWLSSGTEKDEQICELLPECGHLLRSTLIGLHILGNIPQIIFVKDNSASKMVEVERLLHAADMGPDFEPTPLGHDMKSPPSTLQKPLQQSLNEMSESLSKKDVERRTMVILDAHDSNEKTFCDDKPSGEINMVKPHGRSDMYGVDHDSILQQIITKKHRTVHRVSDGQGSGSTGKGWTSLMGDLKSKPQSRQIKICEGKQQERMLTHHYWDEADTANHGFTHSEPEVENTEEEEYGFEEDEKSAR